jgi:hypothetical protein
MRNHAFRETDCPAFNRIVDDLMATYDYPDQSTTAAAE